MNAPAKIPGSLPRHFEVTATSSGWHLKCRVCGERWSLTYRGAGHAGNVLALLNHAASHTKVRPS